MAFDFGTKRIGIAVGRGGAALAEELSPLPANEGIPNWDNIAALLTEWQPSCAIVGLPTNMDGSESEMTRRARKFGNRLKGRFGIPVYFVDERLTTRAAREEITTRRKAGQKQGHSLDSIAARLILEDWFRQSSVQQ